MAIRIAAKFRIGTRGSPLALAQARMVRDLLAAACGLTADALPIVTIRTSGDAVRDRPLADAGGKGLFTKEIEEALLARAIDLAVHSAKDVPTFLPDGLRLAAFPPREDPRDAFVSVKAGALSALAGGALLGTASARREALVRRLRPDIEVKLLRGNVQTRLDKISNGTFDATILALAGLKRLGLADRATQILDPEMFPPSVGQGALAIEVRAGDAVAEQALAAINDVPTAAALATERAFLAELDGSCRTPIGGYARIEDGRVCFHGIVISHDGREFAETTREGLVGDAESLGADAGRELRARAPAGVLAA